MKKLAAIVLLLALAAALGGCGESQPSEARPLTEQEIIQQKIEANFNISDEEINLAQLEEPEKGMDIAVIETSIGTIKMALFSDLAPNAVKSFKEMAADGRYNGQKISHILKNYLIQFGGTTGTAPFENEYSLDLWNFRGAVGMVNSAGGTNGNQLYIIQNNGLTQEVMQEMKESGFPKIVQENYKKLGGAPWMDGKYTVFGQVIEGMSVVDTIAVTAAESASAAEVSSSASGSAASSSTAVSAASGVSSQEENAVTIIGVTIEKYGQSDTVASGAESASSAASK